MIPISKFSGKELELLVSLPYKIGIWISYADDEHGERDDQREREALTTTIQRFATLYEGDPLINDVLKQTLILKTEWPIWREGAFHTVQEAELLTSLLKSKMEDKQRKGFNAMLLEIATSVAQAYGEFNSFDEPEQEEAKSGFGGLVSKVVSRFAKTDEGEQEEDHPMNISAAEDSALEQLKAALRG